MSEEETIIDHLERILFFNQRAGRELWFDKSKEVQDRDIENSERRTDYENGDWVYGFISKEYDERFPNLPAEMTDKAGVTGIEVDYQSIGEYTGLTDKNGTRIFEGDIVDVLYNPRYGGVAKQRIGIRKVVFEEGCFMMEGDEGYHLHFIVNEDVTVVGNIHDNPELLEGED